MKIDLNNLSILVNTCDTYDDLWEPFFKLFDKFGGELKKCPIYLNTESKTFFYDGLNIICPNKYNEPVEWGRRLRKTLSEIKTDYVLFLLDDFFLQRPANTEMISQCLTWLKKNKNVGAFNFIPIEPAQVESAIFQNFCLMPIDMMYRFNAQCCLWNKYTLYNSLLDIESPWEWEFYGNIRNKTIMRNIELYSIKYGINEPYNYGFVDYTISTKDNIVVHSAVMRGKWDLSCIGECFKENDINIDYSIRGLYVPEAIPKKHNFIYRCLIKVYHILFWFKFKKIKKQLEEKQRLLVDDPIKEFLNNSGVADGK